MSQMTVQRSYKTKPTSSQLTQQEVLPKPQSSVDTESVVPPKYTTGDAKCARAWTASTAGVMALSESFFKPLVVGNQKASLASLSL